MDATTSPRRRPVLLTLAVVLVYLSGIGDTAIGILVLLSRYQVPAADVLWVSLLGAGIILFGLLTLTAGASLARGSGLARLLVSIYLALQLALHAITIVQTDAWDAWSTLQIVLQLFVLVVVWVPPASRFFGAIRTPSSS